jgi:hypothetical protein
MASIVAAAFSMALVYPLVRSFGALGIVAAAVAGQAGNLLYLILAVVRVPWTKSSVILESQT